MNDFDHRFFRAIAVGAVLGFVALWTLLTVAVWFVTDETFLTIAGLSLLPGVFCGPFLGGLFTTAKVERDAEDVAEVIELQAGDRARAA